MLDPNHGWLLFMAMASGVFWLIAYLLIIYRGFKDHSYGMPVVALIGNLAWEIIFGLGIETGCPATWSSCPGTLIQVRNFIWMLFDFVILYTVLKYGRQYFTGFLQKYFYAIVFGGIAVALALIYSIVQEFWIQNAWGVIVNGQTPAFLPLKIQGGSYYTGFGLNLIMSILFIFMIGRRGNVEGQSIYIAISKWLGSLAAYGFMLADSVQTPVVNVLYAVVFVLDVLYIWMVYSRARAEGLNPWRRP
ncbi:MAG: hypothetical protein ACK2UK_19060 [Candidatus Promineifilaceae bacterium]|jgi:hypothetical protein